MAKTFYIDRSKKVINWNYSTYSQIKANSDKLIKCIDSCTNCKQLKSLHPFIQNHFYNIKYVGLLGFTAIELMDKWEARYKELETIYDSPLWMMNINIFTYKDAKQPLYKY